MIETCYNDSIPAGASNFLKLVSKYGYCQENQYLLDPCHDLYVMMCLASFQVALGFFQILKAITGQIKSGSKVRDITEISTIGPEFSLNLASDIGLFILGTLRLVMIRFSILHFVAVIIQTFHRFS